ncbi:MAG: AroM family protein [Chloroflexota bacterium]
MPVGFVTIGQSPRSDVLDPFRPPLAGVEIIEAGALDALTRDEIAGLAPGGAGSVLVTRLRDGSHVVLDKDRLMPHLEGAITGLFDRGLRVVVLLCTADFPALMPPGLLIPAQAVMRRTVDAVLARGRLGVLIPLAEQAQESCARFIAPGRDVRVFTASPYDSDSPARVAAAADELRAWRPDLVVLDCLGYSEAARSILARTVTCPTIRPASLIAHYV